MIKKIAYAVLGLMLLAIISIVGIDLWISEISKNRIYTDANLIPAANSALILGTAKRLKNGKSNHFYEYRIRGAVELYNDKKIEKIIVSGDNALKSYNEPRVMTFDLVARGIPRADIELDFAGFRTLDSVVRAKSVFNQSSYIIVSQRFHCERALFIAQAKDIDATCFAVQGPSDFQIRFREYFARTMAFIDLYVLHKSPKFVV